MTKLTQNPIDIHVGQTIKTRRSALKITQTELANHLGITFQQVQKYEKGANRVSASRLWEIADFLNCSVMDFYEGLKSEAQAVDPIIQAGVDYACTREGVDMSIAVAALTPKIRSSLLAHAKTLANA